MGNQPLEFTIRRHLPSRNERSPSPLSTKSWQKPPNLESGGKAWMSSFEATLFHFNERKTFACAVPSVRVCVCVCLFLQTPTSSFWIPFPANKTCWCSAGNEKWNDPYKPSNWWFPLRGPLGSFLHSNKKAHSFGHRSKLLGEIKTLLLDLREFKVDELRHRVHEVVHVLETTGKRENHWKLLWMDTVSTAESSSEGFLVPNKNRKISPSALSWCFGLAVWMWGLELNPWFL